MSSFITQCPHCETSFNITQAQLKLANGKVRCGFCLRTFSALEQQLFIEEDLESSESKLEEIKIYPATIQDNSEDLIEEYEALINQDVEHAQYEKAEETFPEAGLEDNYEEDSLYVSSLPESDNEEDCELEEFQPEQNEKGSETSIEIEEELSAEEVIVGIEESIEDLKELEELESIDDTENIDNENDIDTEDHVEANLETSTNQAQDEEIINVNEAMNEDKEPFPEDTKRFDENDEETALDEELEEYAETKGEGEELSDLETLTISKVSAEQESEKAKRKEELKILETLYDEEALTIDGDNPVIAISEQLIPIYRQKIPSAYFTFLLFFSNIILILAVAAQYSWANIDTYLRDSRFVVITGFICNFANCPDAQRFDLSLFSTDQLLVIDHPSVPDALQIDFIFSNKAEFEQLFPLVELNFLDLNNRPVANRLFKPEDYLEQELQQFTQLPPNSSIQVRLEIADPGAAAINYSLALRAP